MLNLQVDIRSSYLLKLLIYARTVRIHKNSLYWPELSLLELFLSQEQARIVNFHSISQIFTTKQEERVRNLKSHLIIVRGRLRHERSSMCYVDQVAQTNSDRM